MKQNVASVETDDSQQNPPGSDDAGSNTNTNSGDGNEFGHRSRQQGTNYIGMLHSSLHQTTNPAVMERVVLRMASQRDDNRDKLTLENTSSWIHTQTHQ
jgi:hypothetical protein